MVYTIRATNELLLPKNKMYFFVINISYTHNDTLNDQDSFISWDKTSITEHNISWLLELQIIYIITYLK